MRKLLTTLAVSVAALGAAAGTAAADVPVSSQQIITTYPNANLTTQSCADNGTTGTWLRDISGHFHDGCTARLKCTSVYGCDAVSFTAINRSYNYATAPNVSQNARIRIISSTGAVIRFHDKSCYQAGRCETRDFLPLANGQSASIQCNGVHYSGLSMYYYNYCKLDMYKVH